MTVGASIIESTVHTSAMNASARLTLPVGTRDHARGPEAAPVTLVEYGDLECPHCGAAYPRLKALQERFGERLRFVFRHFPLTNAHPHAQAAAEATEWAASQGRFWELHDAIYEQQKQLSDAHLLRLADQLALDRASLARTLEQHTFFARVKEDFLSGIQSGVKGTPAFFINDVRHDGDASTLAPAIEAALASR
jgi:protein-disulfide isomerase